MEIALFASSLVVFIAYLVIAFISYKKREQESFKMCNHFPYELWIKKGDSNFLLNIFIFIPFVIAAVNYVLFAVRFYDIPTLLSSLMAVILAFAAVSIFIIPLSKLREHCIMVIILMAFTAIHSGFLIYKEIRLWELDRNYILLLPLIINALCGIFALFNMFHPALFNFNMNRDSEGNLVRPRNFIIAICEWGLIIALLLNQTSIIVIRMIS